MNIRFPRYSCFYVLLYIGIFIHAQTIPLSPEDREWLDTLSPIRISYDPEFAPFESTGPEGTYTGAAADILQLVAENLGVEIEVVYHDTWVETVEAIRNGEIDLLPCVGRNPAREHFLHFSDPYLQFARVVVTRRDFEFTRLEDIAKGKIGVQKSGSHHGYLAHNTKLEPVLYDSFLKSMQDLAAGEIHAVVGNLATVTHVIQNLSLANLKIAGQVGGETFSLQLGVRQGLERLVPLLNQALLEISPAERNRILDLWIPLPQDADPELPLTRKEREWLLANPRIRVGWDPEWAPVEFLGRDGQPRGLSVDLLKEIESRLGIRFVYEPPRSWPETIERLEKRQLDMVSCVGWVEEREGYMSLSESYLSAPVVWFTRKDSPYIRDVRELYGQTVAVPLEYMEAIRLQKDHPAINLLHVNTVTEGLRAVKNKEADAFAGSVMQGNYYLSGTGSWELVISGETPYENELQFGVRRDWPLLADILDKTLEAIPEEDIVGFYRDWVLVEYHKEVDFKLVLQVVLGSGVLLILALLWNRRLAREIQLRKRAEQKVLEGRTQLEKSFLELKLLEQQKENLTQMIVHDLRSPLTVMMGALDMAEIYLQPGKEKGEECRNLMQTAKTQVSEMSDRVTTLLDVSRLEEGEMPLHPRSGSLLATIEKSMHGFAGLAGRQEISLSVSGEETPCAFDPDLIHRVCGNLLHNAIKACSKGGRIQVRVTKSDGRARVEIQDSGCGIDAKDKDRIFEKFSQTDSPHRKENFTASSGVGLAFCKLAVKAHGGEIGVESRLYEGSTFWFEIPDTPNL